MNTLFATALLATAASGMVISEFDTQDRVTGEYIVQVHDQMNAGRQVAAFDLVSSMGGRVFDVYEHGFQGFAVSGLTDELAEKLSYEPMVKLVEPNYIQTIQQACDTTTSRNWGLSRVTSSSSVSGTPGSTQFPNSYAQGAPCGADVELFILDTGVRRNHVDFGGQSDIFFGDYVNPSNPFRMTTRATEPTSPPPPVASCTVSPSAPAPAPLRCATPPDSAPALPPPVPSTPSSVSSRAPPPPRLATGRSW